MSLKHVMKQRQAPLHFPLGGAVARSSRADASSREKERFLLRLDAQVAVMLCEGFIASSRSKALLMLREAAQAELLSCC